jgi:hypothetical protein
MPVQSVTRQEFDELKAQYATIIEMLTSITTTHKPIVQTCEMSTQTEEEVIKVVEPVAEPEPVEEVKEQPKATPKKAKKQPTIEDKYDKALNDLLSHPYYSRTNEKGEHIFKCLAGTYNKASDVITRYTMYHDNVKNGGLWAMQVMNGIMTIGEVDELKKKKLHEISQDANNLNRFKEIEIAYKKAKKSYDSKQKKKPQEVVQTVEEVVEKVEEVVEKVEEVVENVEEVVEKVEEVAKPVIEETVQKVEDEFIDIEDTKHKAFLLDCCMNCHNGGLANAYHYLNNHKTWHIVPHEQKETYKEEIEQTEFEIVMVKDVDENGEEYEYEMQRPVLDKNGQPKKIRKVETIEHKFRTFKAFNTQALNAPCFHRCRDCLKCECKRHTCKLCKQCANCKKAMGEYKHDMKEYEHKLKNHKVNDYKPIKFADIRDKIKDTYDTLCAVWMHHRRVDYDVFDYRVDWDKVSVDLVNDDTIDQFFYKSNVKYDENQ